jgi:DNA-binding SARP family transcriptional activator
VTVQLQLLGSAERALDGGWQPIPVQQSLLFSAYLAYREDWVQRDELLALFWPDQDEKTARHNLSQLLYHCRRQRWAAGLEAERQRVRWPIATDVQAFREAVGAGDWGTAVSRYRGELLMGVMADDTAGYQSWLEEEREALATD